MLPLVGGSLFLLVTGAANIARWYPWEFFFPVGHWWAAWLVLGATMIHVALKAPTIGASLRRRGTERPRRRRRRADPAGPAAPSAGAAAVLTLITAGQTVPFLRRLTLLAPRRPDIGPQGLPVNRTAEAAGTTGLAAGRLPPGRHRAGTSRAQLHPGRAARPAAAHRRAPDLVRRGLERLGALWTGVRWPRCWPLAGLEPVDATVHSAQQGGVRQLGADPGRPRDPTACWRCGSTASRCTPTTAHRCD